MPLTIGTIASCYVFAAPILITAPVISFMDDVTTSVFLSSTAGTWSVPIINTTYEWLSSTDNNNWSTTSITQSSSSFFGLDNTYLRTIVRGVDSNLTPVSAASLSVYTSGITFKPVVLQLNGDNIIPVPKDIFLDSSSNNFTITRNGSVTQGTVSPFPLNGAAYSPTIHGGSAYFDGSSYLTVPANSNFNFSTGIFTVECWVNINNVSSGPVIASNYLNSNNGWTIQVFGNKFIVALTGDGVDIQGSTTVIPGTWYHIAVSGSPGSYKLFVNGIQEGATFTGATALAGTTLNIGRYSSGLNVVGYISNLRIVNGTNLYPSNFTPPTSPVTSTGASTSLLLNFTNSSVLDITSRNNVMISGNAEVSNSVTKFGEGALSFDGTGDYLNVPVNSNLILSTTDFTIEAWVYMKSGGSQYTLFNTTPHATLAISLNRTGVGNTYVYTGNGPAWLSPPSIISSTNLSFNAWHHVALVKNSNTCTLYHNGSSVGSTSFVPSGFTGSIYIGSIFTTAPSEYFNGYIDDFRITKGVARYTGPTFTLPTTAYPVR